MRRGLNAAFDRFRTEDDAWVAIVTGAGRAFCAGADMRDGAGSAGEFGGTFWEKPTINSFESGWEIFKPVIAAVNGYCLGYGLTLVTWCDFVIASERAEFGFPGGRHRRADHRGRDPPPATHQLAVRDGAAAHGRAHRRRPGQGDRARGLGRAARRADDRGPHARRAAGARRPRWPRAATKEVAVRSQHLTSLDAIRFGETMRRVAAATERRGRRRPRRSAKAARPAGPGKRRLR